LRLQQLRVSRHALEAFSKHRDEGRIGIVDRGEGIGHSDAHSTA
jgi:hypothetical protein